MKDEENGCLEYLHDSQRKREIFRHGSYERLAQLDHTAIEHSLSDRDYLLMWCPKNGEIICKQGYGTWCEQNARDVFLDLKRLLKERMELLEVVKCARDLLREGIGSSENQLYLAAKLNAVLEK